MLKRAFSNHPALLAWVLECRARSLHASQSHAVLIIIAAALVIPALGFVLWFVPDASYATKTTRWLLEHPLAVALGVFLYTLLAVIRRRAHFRAAGETHWLLTAPFARIEPMYLVRLLAWSLFEWSFAAAILFLMAARVEVLEIGILVLALTSGVAIGLLLGLVVPLAHSTQRNEDSRYVLRRKRIETPSFVGLSQWPIAHALAWHRPENARWVFIVAALSVPMGSSALFGLGIVAVWSLVSYLLALVRAIPCVTREAAQWLRPTTIPFPMFAWSILRRVLLHQCCGALVLGGCWIAVGASWPTVASYAALWISLISMVGTIQARLHFENRLATARTVSAVALVLAAELMVRGLGLAASWILTGLHLRGSHVRA